MEADCRPWGFHWRSSPSFIITTVAMGLFTDLVLYGIVVPVIPFMLSDRFQVPDAQIQSYTSNLLAVYAGTSVLFSVPAGFAASKLGSRQLFLSGLAFLCFATAIFAFANSITLLVIGRLLQGMSTAVVWTAGLDMVQNAVEPGSLGEAIGTIFATISIGELGAPLVGGMVYEWAGMIAVFGVAVALLTVDLSLRVLVIDKNVAIQYTGSHPDETDTPAQSVVAESHEGTALLCHTENDRFTIRGEPGSLIRAIPVLYCFREPRLHVAMLLSFVQGILTGALDATIPTEAQSLFHFSSLQVGLVFVSLMAPYLALGRLAGQAVDTYGTKAVTISGYAYLIPCLLLLGLPEQRLVEGSANIVLFCTVLALNGVGLAVVSSPGFVEAIDIISKYEAANPQYFSHNGPYAQLFGFNSLYWFSGLAIGPLLGGFLRTRLGYEAMAAVFAAISAMTVVAASIALEK